MRLVRYKNGAFKLLSIHKTNPHTLLTPLDFENCIRNNMDGNGVIPHLSIDFCGSYLPLVDERDVRASSVLLCAYHNSLVCAQPCTDPHKTTYSTRENPVGLGAWKCHPKQDKELETFYGISDDEDEKETQYKLGFEYEQNADIEDAPNFGKTGIRLW
jgi:hypothetical protein